MEPRNANACLIAAAPDLLAECRRLQAENERLREALRKTTISKGDHPNQILDFHTNAVREARALLEATEGAC